MKNNKDKGIISGSIRHQKIVWIIVAVVVAFGIYALVDMKKDEFPAFSYPQGIVAGIYPGANSEEVEAQLTKPLEELLFSIPEVDRQNTYSISKEGICYTYVMLDMKLSDHSKAWTKIRQKIAENKTLGFPAGVLAIAVIDDFGNTSSLLIAMESADKTYREMREYTDDLTRKLRDIPQTGNVQVLGEQTEEIAVTVDKEKLSFYGISPNTLMLHYASQGLLTTSGTMETEAYDLPLHIENPVVSEQELEEQIIYSDATGNTVRLRDVATVERRLAPSSKVVNFNGNDALIISVEMRKGYNIVAYGRKVEKVLSEFKSQLPDSVQLYRITDQPKVVQKSVSSFLRDLLISMIVVIAVMLLLFPFRTALIASSGLPICTAVSIGLMYLFGIELNTVTLAALIVVLGMIVDDSIINIDGYIDKLSQGMEPFEAATSSAKELFMPMFIATAAIATMFFPMTRIITGPLGDFVQLFPWTVAFSLMASLAYAMLVIPSLEILFIKPETDKPRRNGFVRAQRRFFSFIQRLYDKMQSHCFRHSVFTIGMGLGSIALGVLMFLALNVQMMPYAERDCFAVEIRLPEGSSLEATTRISDSLQRMMLHDPRVTSVTAFIGETAPRFHVTYAPSIPAPNLSQLIVNTTSKQATEDLLKEMDDTYSYYFTEAHVRFRQLDYQAVTTPIEIFVYGDDYEKTSPIAQQIKDYMLSLDRELRWVHTDNDEQLSSVKVTMKPEECARLGITKGILSLDLATTLNGQPLTTLWEGTRSIPVKLYSKQNYDPNDYESVQNQLIPTMIPGTSVPLRQVATISPEWHPAQITHHNGKNAITVAADMKFWKSQTASMKKIKQFINTEIVPNMPEGVSIEYGGLSSLNVMVVPQILKSLIAAILVLLAFLVAYFKKFSLAVLTLCSSALCMFGAFFGEWLFGLDFGMTSVLGVVSLIGIIVRNGIVMYEYAETLRVEEGLSAKEAAMKAGSRRMRPIFLTSATTALGVLPMIITRNPLWMPMGVVICFGVVLSMVIILAVMPVMYWLIYSEELGVRSEELGVRSEKLGVRSEKLEVRSEELEVRSEKLGVRSEKLGVRSEELGVRSILRKKVTSHLSPLTSHLSPLTSHLSPLTFHLSPLTSHLSPLTLISALLMAVNVFAQDADTLQLSVQDCIDRALENNYPLKNAQLEIEKAKALKNEVRAEYFPSMSAQAFAFGALNPLLSVGIDDIDNALVRQTLNNLYTQYGALLGLEKSYSFGQQGAVFNLMVTEPLYAGGRIRTGNRLAKMGIEAAEYQAMIKSEGIKLVTEYLYWQIIALEDKVVTLDRLDQLLDTLDKDLDGAIEAGLMMPTDRYKLTVKKNESALNRKKVENGMVLLKMALAQQIGVDWQTMVLTDTLGLEEEPTAYYQNPNEAVASRKEIQLLDLSTQAERLKKKLTLGEALPSLLVGGSANYHTLLYNTKPNAMVFAVLQVPITDWHKTSWKLKRHDLDIQKAENTRNELTEQLQLQTNLAWFNLEQSYLQVTMAKTALSDAEANMKISSDYYEAGLISLAELLEAQTLLQKSHNELIDSRVNYRISLVTYRQLTGTLSTKMESYKPEDR